MRMLVTSAVHMDVSQIALCVVTIPKLKSAVQLLLNPPLPNKEYQPSVVAVNHPVNEPVSNSREILNTSQLYSYSDDNMAEESLVMDQDYSIERDRSPASSTSLNTAKKKTITNQSCEINLESSLADDSDKTQATEISLVGGRIAVGRPGKSRAKTDKRVRYITCRVCHLLFYKRDQYREHMLIHANDPNINIYACDQCTFVTKRRGVFNTHKLRHTGDLPFKCELCDYAGRQASLLRQHMFNKHSVGRQLPNGDEATEMSNSLQV
ncbi:hypothetical protein EB796_001171 [Bugula neritina]|uniref:C2H2-type domain-containing protein n=1 Tax=Bugula neritina TaxID=10212 RepID=A0A7J7KQQ0_BUGNE|nr:hypothetical protein EB796_001171 [Bugula neritina]